MIACIILIKFILVHSAKLHILHLPSSFKTSPLMLPLSQYIPLSQHKAPVSWILLRPTLYGLPSWKLWEWRRGCRGGTGGRMWLSRTAFLSSLSLIRGPVLLSTSMARCSLQPCRLTPSTWGRCKSSERRKRRQKYFVFCGWTGRCGRIARAVKIKTESIVNKNLERARLEHDHEHDLEFMDRRIPSHQQKKKDPNWHVGNY